MPLEKGTVSQAIDSKDYCVGIDIQLPIGQDFSAVFRFVNRKTDLDTGALISDTELPDIVVDQATLLAMTNASTIYGGLKAFSYAQLMAFQIANGEPTGTVV
ncbi:MAG: hypothetical protein JWM68_2532 [Verrucomicrobiales bacterium]|nr:hypothetical protein [Verrucomicrobiales bacterium]